MCCIVVCVGAPSETEGKSIASCFSWRAERYGAVELYYIVEGGSAPNMNLYCECGYLPREGSLRRTR